MCFTNSCKINKAIKIVFSSGDRYISSSGNEEKETILDGKFTFPINIATFRKNG